MYLTDKLLARFNACAEQRAEFRRLFPHGCRPTIQNLTILRQTEYRHCVNPEDNEAELFYEDQRLDPYWLFGLFGSGSRYFMHAQEGWRIYDQIVGTTSDSYHAAQEARLAYLALALQDEEEAC